MKDEVMKMVAKDIAVAHYDVLLTAFEEQKYKFPVTMCMINLMVNLKQKNIVYNLGDVFNINLIDKMYREAENDTLVVFSLDRFGRPYNQIIEEWQDITKNIGADIVVLDMPLLDTSANKDLLGAFISDIVLQLLSLADLK